MFKVIGQRSRTSGQIFRRGDTSRFALPLLIYYYKWKILVFELDWDIVLYMLEFVAQTSIKFKSEFKLNRHLNILEMYMELIYT
jgi:hypothetical protein